MIRAEKICESILKRFSRTGTVHILLALKPAQYRTVKQLPLASDFLATPTVIISIQQHLQHAQNASSEVEQNVPYAPTNRAFPLIIHVRLRDVLDQRDGQFDVGTEVEEVQPVQDVGCRTNRADEEKSSENTEDHHRGVGHPLVVPLVHEALHDGDYGGEGGVQGEHYVVDLHWI